MTTSFRIVLLAGAILLPGAAANAADVTADQAKAAQAAVRTWVDSMVGPAVKLPPGAITLTPAGDHFDLKLPFLTLPGQPSVDGVITGKARPLLDGKWAIDDLRTPTPLKFTVLVPAGTDDSADDKPAPAVKPKTKTPPGKPKVQAKPTNIPVEYTFDISGQDGHAVLDPSLATASTWTATAKGVTIRTEGGPAPSLTTIGSYDATSTLQPSGPSHLDLKADAKVNDYRFTMTGVPSMPITIEAKAFTVGMALLGLDRVKSPAVSRAAAALLVAVGTPGTAPKQTKVAPELISAMLDALKDSASEASLSEAVDDLSVTAGSVPVTMSRVSFALDAKSNDGMLEASMPIEVHDIAVTGVLPPDMAALLPTVVAMQPTISGVSVAELSRLAAKYNETHKDPTPAELQALFEKGGVKLGLQSMNLAFAGAVFEAQGAMTYTSPTKSTGTLHLTATGYDDMMQKVAAIPALSGKAVPALAFVKGIGKVENNTIVWDIAYNDGKTTVNNVDMSTLTGGAAK